MDTDDIDATVRAQGFLLELALQELHRLNPHFLEGQAEEGRELADQLPDSSPQQRFWRRVAETLESALDPREIDPGSRAARHSSEG